MAAGFGKRISDTSSSYKPGEESALPAHLRGQVCSGLRVHAACVLRVVYESAPDVTHDLEFFAAGEGIEVRVQEIKGSSDGTTATSYDVFWGDR